MSTKFFFLSQTIETLIIIKLLTIMHRKKRLNLEQVPFNWNYLIDSNSDVVPSIYHKTKKSESPL